ncbi:hypothetical protein C5167_028962 [Papaver somniferum]|uniref:uncharacterized protein LOC113337281 n=1 Tax=Papaver somniferum TaxID=3469 RepID=UPI000E6F94D4|nr:uncharacterized protein LOC113337281 [Papaver somniferum]RZC89896.1 hypothetical protein C5167_028962 [Papaver somniferum]
MMLSANAKKRRNRHSKQNWKNKVERRKLEAEGKAQIPTNDEEIGQVVPNDDEGAQEFDHCPDDIDFCTVKIRREKVEYSMEEVEKLKELVRKLRCFTNNKRKKGTWSELLKLGKDVFKACRTGEDLRLKWRSMKTAGLVD